ncbi:MAG: TetR/AcrR family transcriptional regulator [Myxococcaceae bacterium]|nr:TetR/AcrR family transcriptional regulator [Myxococcaceae bacterium]
MGRAAARLSHGERTRREILDVAVQLGATEGLEGLTIGRLADAVGLSKGGTYAHFGSKLSLQLATVETALTQFQEEVVAPALQHPPGVEQLRAFTDGYFAYLERRRDRGGCFFTAAALEFDDRPGEVRDALRAAVEARDAVIKGALGAAVEAKELPRTTDVDQLAFEVAALCVGANVGHQLLRQSDALERARRALDARLQQLSYAALERRRK